MIFKSFLTLALFGALFLALPSLSFANPQKPTPRNRIPFTPKTAVGIGIGTINGISVYHQWKRRNFMQGMLNYLEGPSFGFTADYGFSYPAMSKELPYVTPYYGFGGFFYLIKTKRGWWGNYKAESFTILGARVPLGMQINLSDAPLQFAFEVAPGVSFIPDFWATVDAQIIVRYVF